MNINRNIDNNDNLNLLVGIFLNNHKNTYENTRFVRFLTYYSDLTDLNLPKYLILNNYINFNWATEANAFQFLQNCSDYLNIFDNYSNSYLNFVQRRYVNCNSIWDGKRYLIVFLVLLVKPINFIVTKFIRK